MRDWTKLAKECGFDKVVLPEFDPPNNKQLNSIGRTLVLQEETSIRTVEFFLLPKPRTQTYLWNDDVTMWFEDHRLVGHSSGDVFYPEGADTLVYSKDLDKLGWVPDIDVYPFIPFTTRH